MARALEALGSRLRHWRRERELTQLALAIDSGISQRHISYLENGRSRVGSNTLQRLVTSLGLEGEDAAELYALAGLASPDGRANDATDPREAMSPAQLEAMHRLFAAHDPLPGIAVDRLWNVVAVNAGASIFGGLAAPERNLAEAFFDPAARERLVDWPRSARAMLARLRSDARMAPDDLALAELYERFAGRVPETVELDPRGIVLEVDGPEGRVSLISLGASFTEPSVRPALRFELFYPADEPSQQRLALWSRHRV